jgi:hypothetical protein
MAATANRRHETVAMVRTDERRKFPPGPYLGWMLSRTIDIGQLQTVISPSFEVLSGEQGFNAERQNLKHRGHWGTQGGALCGTGVSSLRKVFLFLPLNFHRLPSLISSAVG